MSASPATDPAVAHQPESRVQRAVHRQLGPLLTDASHLVALSAFAVAQPLFDLLGRTPTFFAVRESTPSDIVVFALAITFLPPICLFAAELVAGLLFGRWLRRLVHHLFIAGLAGLFCLQVLNRLGVGSGRLLLLAAGALGLGAAFAYARLRGVRSTITVLSSAPVVFLILFLAVSPVRRLVFLDDAQARVAPVSASAPVVMVVLDEFAEASMMNRRREVDSVRYPNLAALAQGSTWYRNAAASNAATERAVPAVLTGRRVHEGSLPIFRDHPQSLFTLLGGSYDLEVFETVTHVCPRRLCARRTYSWGLHTLLSDLAVVYLSLTLPDDVTRDLPSITTAWGNFHGEEGGARERFPTRPATFERFVNALVPHPRPTLYFLHVTLPHVPYQYVPSGKRYAEPDSAMPGLEGAAWEPDHWLVTQAQQRYLLQLGYVDQLIGEMLRQLEATGLYNRALLVLMADHGVSFHPGEGRRWTSAHPEDIVFIPLFIKAPGQRAGRVVDRPVQSIDVLPMVARLLGIRIPWSVDGRPALDGRLSSQLQLEQLTLEARPLLAARDRAIVEQAARFGDGEPWERVYEIGPHPELVGRSLTAFTVNSRSTFQAEIENQDLLSIVDRRAEFLPIRLNGTLRGKGARPGLELAIAINGSIAATTRTYSSTGDVRFAALVPESSLRSGPNSAAVLSLSFDGGRITLTNLGETGAQEPYVLSRDARGEFVTTPSGDEIRVLQGAVTGYLDVAEIAGREAHFAGWAGDATKRRPRDSVLVFVDGRFLLAIRDPPPLPRRGLPPGLDDAAFDFHVPLTALGREPARAKVRLLALVGGVASELHYPAHYPWPS